MDIKDDVESPRKILKRTQELITQLKAATKKLKDANAVNQKENEDFKKSLAELERAFQELQREKEDPKVDSGSRKNVAAFDAEMTHAKKMLKEEKDEVEVNTVGQKENAESGKDEQAGNSEKQLKNNEDVSKQHGQNAKGTHLSNLLYFPN